MFAGGGGVAAMLLPIHILLFGIAAPLGWVDSAPFSYEKMHALLSCPAAKIYMLTLIALPLFHAAHRVMFTLIDLGLKDARVVLNLLCHGGAVVGSLAAAYFLWMI